jgi:hypothetical protein
LPKLPLVGSLLPYFVLFLVVEITILNRQASAGVAEGARTLLGARKAGG